MQIPVMLTWKCLSAGREIQRCSSNTENLDPEKPLVPMKSECLVAVKYLTFVSVVIYLSHWQGRAVQRSTGNRYREKLQKIPIRCYIPNTMVY